MGIVSNQRNNAFSGHMIPTAVINLPPNTSTIHAKINPQFSESMSLPKSSGKNKLHQSASTCHTHEAHPRLIVSKSLHGVFQNRLSGPLAALQPPKVHNSPVSARVSGVRTPRGVKRAARNGRWKMMASREALKHGVKDKENNNNNNNQQINNNSNLFNNTNHDMILHQTQSAPLPNSSNIRFSNLNKIQQTLSMPTSNCLDSMRDSPTSLINTDDNWTRESSRNLSTALDQLVALCNQDLNLNPAFSSNTHPSQKQNNFCPQHSSLTREKMKLPNRAFKDKRNKSLSSIVFNANDKDEPRGGGVAKRVGVVLKALGDRLVSWSKGESSFNNNWTQVSSHHSESSDTNRFKGPSTPTPPPTHPSSQTDNMTAPTVGGGAFVPFKRKVVIALYDYKAARPGDLSLKRQEEYEVLEDSLEHWWKMRDQNGQEGYAPSNYVRESTNDGLQAYDWYLGDASRQSAEDILMHEGKEGCFVVRNSTTELGKYTLSVFSKLQPHVKHYHIKTGTDGKYFLSPKIRCDSIPDLIFRHQHTTGGLCTRLRTAELSHAKWEIHPSELSFLEVLGTGQFGVVRHAKFCGIDVAVKMMKEGTMSEDEFIEEAKVMTNLQHENLVQLYGVCRRQRPIYIVTEYMKYGSLLHYLRNNQRQIFNNINYLLDICFQICNGMLYLETQKFIHRDLAARNCLVGSGNVIKVGDFGLARYVVDDEYTGSGGAKFPIKWAAPEVLNFMRFSSKSDVWAFGVLVWEVFTCGKMPYGRKRNAEVVEMVQDGKLLEQPRHCPDNIYDVMVRCWTTSAEERPGFSDLYHDLQMLIQQ